jgi:hypothetical protein
LRPEWRIDKIHSRFFKVTVGVPRFAEISVGEPELERDSTRGKVLSMTVKFWLRLLCIDSLEIVRTCYEWQINNLKVEDWAKKLKKDLDKIGLAYI